MSYVGDEGDFLADFFSGIWIYFYAGFGVLQSVFIAGLTDGLTKKCTSPLCPPIQQFYPKRPNRRTGKPKPRWVLHFVLDCYAQSGQSYRNVRHEFNRQYAHTGMTVSLGTVYHWIQKHSSELETIRRETRNRFPDEAPANLRWCLDGTGKFDAGGVNHFILGIIDHGTRTNLLLQRLELATSAVILEQVKATIKLFGLPKIIRTDNAPVFRSKKFRRCMKELGIRQEFSEPGKPWQNGRIERFFLTLKEKLNVISPINGMALDNLLRDFTVWYNVIRPHQHLYGHTPAEVWQGINPYTSGPTSVECFSAWEGLLCGYYLRR